MEAAEPIRFETPKPFIDNTKIDFIEELTVNEEYKLQFGVKEKDLVFKVVNNKSKDIYYYQKIYTLNELQNLSKVFAIYETIKDLIQLLKNLKYEIEEKNEDLIIKFNVFTPDGKSKLIELHLIKNLSDANDIIKYLLEEIKSIKNDKERIKNESEIKSLKEENSNFQKEIDNLKEENKKLWNEINK